MAKAPKRVAEPKKILEDIVTGKVCISHSNEKGTVFVLTSNGIWYEPKDPENLPKLFDSRAEAKQELTNILADTSDLVTSEYLKKYEKQFKDAIIVPASKFVGQDFIIEEFEDGYDIKTRVVLKQLQRPIKHVIEEMRYNLQSGIDDSRDQLKALRNTIKDREIALNTAISDKTRKLNTFESALGDFDFSLL